MSTLVDWSFGRVLLVSAAWILLCVLVVAAWLFFQFRLVSAETGSGGIGAVSFGISVLTLLIPVGPPILLIVVWTIARWMRPA